MGFFEYFAPKFSNLDASVIAYIILIVFAVVIFRNIARFAFRLGAVIVIILAVLFFATDLIGFNLQSFSDYVTGNFDKAIDNAIKKW